MKTTMKAILVRQSIISFLLGMFSLCLTPALAKRPPSGNGKAIKDAVTGFLGKTATLTNNLGNLCDINCQSTDGGKVLQGKIDQLKQDQQRAQNANGRSKGSDFQGLIRKRGKKKSEGCDPEVQVCSDPSTSTFTTASSVSSEPEFDEEEGKDLIETIDEAGSDIDQLNDTLSTNTPQANPTVYAASATGLHDAPYYFTQRPSTKLAFDMLMADMAAGKLAAIMDQACKQDAVALGEGGNTSLACIVVKAAYKIADAAYKVIEFIRSDNSSAEITGTYERAADIYNEVAATAGDIDALKSEIDTLGNEIMELQKNQTYIMQLLVTPQGQRPGFAK